MTPVHMANGFDPESSPELDADASALLERRSGVMSTSYRLFYDRPVDVVRASGCLLYDAAGRDFLDMYNNVPGIGHSHPRVTEYVSAQVGLLNTHTRYLTEAVVDYSERLLATFPAPLSRITYACTGSEAVDLAVRTARFATGRRGVVVTSNAYHGTTDLTAGMSPSLGPNAVLGPDVVTVAAPHAFRDDPATAAAEFAGRIREAAAGLEASGAGLAAVVVDSILSSDGVQPGPVGMLAEAADVTRELGGLWIADEVQPGFGRTGRMWGFERHGEAAGTRTPFVPDIVALGKPMGNGMPISAVVTSPEVGDEFGRSVRYFNTFGGNPVTIAAARAVLETVQDDGLAAHAARSGDALAGGIRELAGRYPALAQVRHAGLFVGVEVVGTGRVEDGEGTGVPDAAGASAIVRGLRERRVLVSASGAEANVLKIRPPLVFGSAENTRFQEALAVTLAEVYPGQR
ncbi:aspartate aminotransferase family protein [Brevibacterium litoralis]|uniref:aspartate aminotransferase family protein n=1 Tax=Brevibacterium litoralis TaxID=3138935 RepID=UPI0032ECF466